MSRHFFIFLPTRVCRQLTQLRRPEACPRDDGVGLIDDRPYISSKLFNRTKTNIYDKLHKFEYASCL